MTRSTTSLRSVAQGRLRTDPAFAKNARKAGATRLWKFYRPTWTKDHKTAALPAAMILARAETVASPRAAKK